MELIIWGCWCTFTLYLLSGRDGGSLGPVDDPGARGKAHTLGLRMTSYVYILVYRINVTF